MRRRDFQRLLERIDGHMARSNDHMARGDDHMTRGNELMERGNELMDRGNALMDEIRVELRANREERRLLQEFIREQTMRMERAAERQGVELAKVGTAMETAMDRIVEHLDDMKDQLRATTEATWRMLDRFDGEGGPATA